MSSQTQTLDAVVGPGPFAASLRGEASKALRLKFPPRLVPDSWPESIHDREWVIARLRQAPLRAHSASTQAWRCSGADKLLRWLEKFPGDTWQQRWCASPAHELGAEWLEEPLNWLGKRGERAVTSELKAGMLALLCADAVRPHLAWLAGTRRSRYWKTAVAAHRDPEGFALLEAQAGPDLWSSSLCRHARSQIATLISAKGGGVRDITVGDCLELREVEFQVRGKGGTGRSLFYSLLKDLGGFPEDAPSTLRDMGRFVGQLSVQQLVDRYDLQCRPIRDVIAAYLAERQPVLDYTTLDDLARTLAVHFWKNLETHHPDLNSLRLPPEVAEAWKQRCQTKVTHRRLPDGTMIEVTSPRANVVDLLTQVRGFYLDIAQWAAEDPARWGPWAAPCPISEAEISRKKHVRRRKARMDQRTRERLPLLPALVRAMEQQMKNARLRLDALRASPPGGSFTVLGETFTKAPRSKSGSDTNIAYDPTGRRRDLALAEHQAFWAWSAVEFLRHTGVRIEEMLEASHHSITQYKLPTTGEIIPLLQVAPSKTDEERVLVVSPELADALSAIVCRIRDKAGAIPLVPSYDLGEKVWNAPMPLLFQWRVGGQNRPVSGKMIWRAIQAALDAAEMTDAAGEPLRYQFHDFRRIFTTEAVMSGMPPHIAQLILGHKDINTTMGYKAVYPEEAINGHRAFIARRRALRPSEEYRTPTDEEWEEFLGHFERRKMALGVCGRAYGTSCKHEHACIRCPLLRVDPAERPRLEEIRHNMIARIAEAEQRGWLGEIEGLQANLAATEGKLAQLDERARRATTVHLGMPPFPDIAGRTATLPNSRPGASS
ncbi:site-specific integrase [Nonomuraea sp. NPDC046802]|uniref:tyrosine-type recombinase/integrase n=1 Tax=Nonomuraea sp. NPDC046802 TaxID=3154919 RepID=UPI003410A30A